MLQQSGPQCLQHLHWEAQKLRTSHHTKHSQKLGQLEDFLVRLVRFEPGMTVIH